MIDFIKVVYWIIIGMYMFQVLGVVVTLFVYPIMVGEHAFKSKKMLLCWFIPIVPIIVVAIKNINAIGKE